MRDGLALAFYAGGMRFGDACLLRWSNVVRDGEGHPVRLVYEAEKTGKPTPIPVLPEAAAILDRYAKRRPEAVDGEGTCSHFWMGTTSQRLRSGGRP